MDTMSSLGISSDLMRAERSNLLSKDVKTEAESEAKKGQRREKKRGWGRLFGGGGVGLLTALALAPFTGGTSILANPLVYSAILGGATGLGSIAGQKATAGYGISPGRFNIAEDKLSEEMYKDQMWTSAGTDALAAAMFAYGEDKAMSLLGNLFKKGGGTGNVITPSKHGYGGFQPEMLGNYTLNRGFQPHQLPQVLKSSWQPEMLGNYTLNRGFQPGMLGNLFKKPGVDFDKAFAAARKAGKKEFIWRGKLYNTKYKGE